MKRVITGKLSPKLLFRNKLHYEVRGLQVSIRGAAITEGHSPARRRDSGLGERVGPAEPHIYTPRLIRIVCVGCGGPIVIKLNVPVAISCGQVWVPLRSIDQAVELFSVWKTPVGHYEVSQVNR